MSVFIAICDDDVKVNGQVESFLLEIMRKEKIEFEIDTYFTGEELCQKMEQGQHYDLIFLDIEFAENGINGIEVGEIIRNTQENHYVSIVYISWEQGYSMQLFNIRPFNFLIKPLRRECIEAVVSTYMKIEGSRAGVLNFKIGHDSYKISIKDIAYMESEDRKVVIHKADGTLERFYGSLKKIFEENLEKHDFIFIHASYVVNYDFVSVFKHDEVKMQNGQVLPISQPRRKVVRASHYAIKDKRGLW